MNATNAAREVIRIGWGILNRLEESEKIILEKIGKDNDQELLLWKFVSLLDFGDEEEKEVKNIPISSPLSSSSSSSLSPVQEVDDVVEVSSCQPQGIEQQCQNTESSMDMQEAVEQETDVLISNFDWYPPPLPSPLPSPSSIFVESEKLPIESLEPQGQVSILDGQVDDQKSPKVRKMTDYHHHHTNSHRPESSFSTKVCRVCGLELNSMEMLMDHPNLHTGNKPYKCRQCRQRFAMKSQLSIHRKMSHLHCAKKFRPRPNQFNRGMGHMDRSRFSMPPPPLPPLVPPPCPNPQLFFVPLVSPPPPLQQEPDLFHRFSASPAAGCPEEMQAPTSQFQENNNCHDNEDHGIDHYTSSLISSLRHLDGSFIHECRLCHQIFSVYQTALAHAKLHNNNWSANNNMY